MARTKIWGIFALLTIAALLLTACELPSPSVGDVQVLDGETTADGTTTDEQPADTAGETGEGEETNTGGDAAPVESDDGDGSESDSTDNGDTVVEDAAGESTDSDETPEDTSGEEDSGDEGDTAAEGDATTDESSPRPQDDESGEEGEGDADADADDSTAADTDADTAGEEDADTAAETTDSTTVETTDTAVEVTTPGVHVVAAGENLYRIGLLYNVSWTTLATVNNIVNPNRLQIGQQIKIPAAEGQTPDPAVIPTPTDETVYVVQPGDNLFLIGLRYGLDWTQIAEANGLVNPNFIQAGQVLKIPADQPGSSPEFTHVVAPGDTLFLISLRYGVTWEAIAEKNEIEAPHVIYPGQPLVIPGGQ